MFSFSACLNEIEQNATKLNEMHRNLYSFVPLKTLQLNFKGVGSGLGA